MPSSVSAAKAAILAGLQARSGLYGVALSWGGPTETEDMAPEGIFFGVTEREQEWQGIGRATRPRRESYTLEVVAYVIRDGDVERETEERVWALVDEIEALVAEDPSLAGALNEFATPGDVRVESRPSGPSAWQSRATVAIECRHSIRL